MAFDAVYTKTIIASRLLGADSVEATPPDGKTWIISDIDVLFSSGDAANHLSFEADFQTFLYWSQPHGMSRQWQWRGRRAVLENLLVVLGGDALGQATINVTVYELSVS